MACWLSFSGWFNNSIIGWLGYLQEGVAPERNNRKARASQQHEEERLFHAIASHNVEAPEHTFFMFIKHKPCENAVFWSLFLLFYFVLKTAGWL